MEQSFEYLISTYGLAGLVIFALGFMCYRLYVRNQELHDTLYELGRDSVKTNVETTTALNRLSDLLLLSRVKE